MGMILDVSGDTCPVPLVKARRAMDKMEMGGILEVIVTGEDSKVNIMMAAKELGMDIVRVREDYGKWHIIIRNRRTEVQETSKRHISHPIDDNKEIL